ncbi:hypothetical protein O181_011322 [Austropuccinia psidii MF-1]|uniref:Uncharacterized protein n=1 Tax=Austropuccinia psidii MF-1 TaxID=1389203 RepID=A0A9Q3BUA0_9BASI|nr:hypothetical protein [Austropuccinia psidii MF-1]
MVVWADEDYFNLVGAKKSTSWFVATLYGNPIFVSTKNKPIVAQSTTKPEFLAIKKFEKKLRCLSMFIVSIGLKTGIPTILKGNMGAVFLIEEAQLNPN